MRGTRRELQLADPDARHLLLRCGVLPVVEQLPERQAGEPCVDWLIRCWEHAAPALRTALQRRAVRLIAALKALDPQSCEVVAWKLDDEFETSIRLCFAPLGIPTNELLAVASSRLRRALPFEQAWLGALRRCVERAKSKTQTLLAVEGTTAERFIRRCGRVLDVPVATLHVADSGETELWFASVLNVFVTNSAVASEQPLYVSPRLNVDIDSNLTSSVDIAPERDRLLVAAADEVIALSVRPKGHCLHLLLQRLRAETAPRVSIIGDDRLTSLAVQSALQSPGAVVWDSTQATVEEPDTHRKDNEVALAAKRASMPFEHELYLTHWTRGLESHALRDMPDDLLEEWLSQPTQLDRTALASLQRLLQSGRIRARRLTATDSVPVVCFSAMPLTELLKHRTYRPHRTRWDAEPFGLCIKREALLRLGVRPVIYGDESTRAALPASEQHLFQPRVSSTRTGAIDWSSEQEWRLPGDLRLEWLGPDDVLVFVRSAEDAERLRGVSHWPIVVLEDASVEATTKQHVS